MSRKTPTFMVRSDPYTLLAAGHVPGSRRAEEQAAIARILSMIPEEQRADAKAFYEDESNNAVPYAVDGNEEMAKLLSLIYSIRDADYIGEKRVTSGEPLPMSDAGRVCTACSKRPAVHSRCYMIGLLMVREQHLCEECATTPSTPGPFSHLSPIDFEVLRASLTKVTALPEWKQLEPYLAGRIREVAAHFGQTIPPDLADWMQRCSK